MSSLAAGEECVVETVYKQSAVCLPSIGRMTNQPAAHQSNTSKAKDKEEPQRDDNTEVAYKDAGHCSRNTHNLLLGLTVMGRSTQTAGTRGTNKTPPMSHPVTRILKSFLLFPRKICGEYSPRLSTDAAVVFP